VTGRSLRLILLALVLLAGASRADEPPTSAPADPPGVAPARAEPALGLCWAQVAEDPASVEALAGLPGGVVLTEPLDWGGVETRAARAGPPERRWEAIDALVLRWQNAGFEVVPVLRPRTAWASEAPERTRWARDLRERSSPAEVRAALAGVDATTPPRTTAWPAWEAFVRDLVERYDHDGSDDAPGLRAAVRYVQILDRLEVPSGWAGDAEEYLRLLHHADVGAHVASAAVRLVHAAPWLVPVGADADAADAVPARTLEMPRLYGAVAAWGDESAEHERAVIEALRARLERVSATDARIWLEASPTRKVVAADQDADAPVRRRWVAAARDPADPEHARALAWLRVVQAHEVVRTGTLARAAGASTVFLVGTDDAAARPGGERRDGLQGFATRAPNGRWERTPSWFAARQWVDLVASATKVEPRPMSGARGRAFHVEHARSPRGLLVLLPDTSLVPGSDEAPADEPHGEAVLLRMPDGRYARVAVALDDGPPAVTELVAANGVLRVPMGAAPAYVLPR
jgi:hypothetical protein